MHRPATTRACDKDRSAKCPGDGRAWLRTFRTNYYGWNTGAENKPAAQLELVAKAIEINPDYAFAYYVKGIVFWLTKEYPEALTAAETEVALDPNSAYGYSAIGRVETLLGRCEQSITHIKQAFALSPRDPYSGVWYLYLGYAEFCRGRLDAAIEQLKRAIVSGYPAYVTYAVLAGAEAAKGNDAEAKRALTGGAPSLSSTHNQVASGRNDANTINRYRRLAQGRVRGRMSAHLFSH